MSEAIGRDLSPVVRVVLVGLMGAGKTTVGKMLASRLGWEFVDSDHEVEARTGVKIPTIFEIEGEDGFRRRESAVIADLVCRAHVVIATGGGAVLRQENRQAMRDAGVIAYLSVAPELLFARTRHDKNRPLLQVEDPLERLRQLHRERDPFYREVANFVVDGNRHNARQIAQLLEREVTARCGK